MGSHRVGHTLLIATGEAIPLRGLEGVPGLPGAPQDDPWDFPCKNTEVGCHFLLQGIFPTHNLSTLIS